MPSKQLRVSCRLPLLFCWHSLIAQPKFVSSAHSLESYLYTVVLAYNPVDLFNIWACVLSRIAMKNYRPSLQRQGNCFPSRPHSELSRISASSTTLTHGAGPQTSRKPTGQSVFLETTFPLGRFSFSHVQYFSVLLPIKAF